MIDGRPAVVERRSRAGHREMDTMIGRPGGTDTISQFQRALGYPAPAVGLTTILNQRARSSGQFVFRHESSGKRRVRIGAK